MMEKIKFSTDMKDKLVSDTILTALVAAGGNSRAARSARAKLQFRDRHGRWIEMGRGLKFKFRDNNGVVRSVIGSFVGAKESDVAQVYVSKDPSGLPDGFYDVGSRNAQEFVAHLSPDQLKERGITPGQNADGTAVSERSSEEIPNLSELTRSNSPEGWVAEDGTFGGKKVISTDDGDFRVHYSGKDDRVLLEDHRARPGLADEQRSMAEAFKRVNEVDTEREKGGDISYTGGLAEDNEAKLAQRSRDDKVAQIKHAEAQLDNDRVGVDQKQRAAENIKTLSAELESEGHPYDPEGSDSDSALAERKAQPNAVAQTPETSGTGLAETRDVDTSSFDVAPEGFLVPTGKKTSDLSPQGLANFIETEKESLSKGGARLVVDSDSNTAEIHNSAETLQDAKAQAGGLGQTDVLDLAAGKPVKVSDSAVDPNSPDVNPNLNGDTETPEKDSNNGENSNPDAVESERSDAGPATPTGDQPDTEVERNKDADAEPRTDESGDGGVDDAPRTPEGKGDEEKDLPAPGSVEDLEQRRAQVQTALENSGDPQDIVALNEQADALDNRIASKSGEIDIPARVRDDRGLTVSPSFDSEPTDGYMVAVQGHNREIPEEEFFDGDRGTRALLSWIEDNRDALSQPDAHVGLWHDTDNGEVVFDVSQRVDTLQEAERLGRERNQQAVWDVANGTEISTGGTGDRQDSDTDPRELGRDVRRTEAGVGERTSGPPATTREGLEAEPYTDETQAQRLNRELDANEQKQEDLRFYAADHAAREFDAELPEDMYDYTPAESLDTYIKPTKVLRDPEKMRLRIRNEQERTRKAHAKLEAELDRINGVQALDFGSPSKSSTPSAQEEAPFRDEMREVSSLDDIRMQSGINEDHVNRLAEVYSRYGYDGAPIGIEGPPGNETITDGNHRAEAAKRAGLSEVPVRVYAQTDAGRIAANNAIVDAESKKTDSGPTYREITPDRPAYQEPGNADAIADARRQLDEIDTEIDAQVVQAERATDPQVVSEHLSRIRTLNNQRKIQENALNRALGNEPMDFNGDLGWSLNDRENRGSLPEAPEGADAPSTPATLPEPTEETPEAVDVDTPAALDDSLDAEGLADLDVMRRSLQGEPLSEADEARLADIVSTEDNTPLEDRLAKAEDDLAVREKAYQDVLLSEDYSEEEFDRAENLREWARQDLAALQDEKAMQDSYARAEVLENEPTTPATTESVAEVSTRALVDAETKEETLNQITPGEGASGVFEKGEDPFDVDPGHTNKIETIKARAQGKELSEEDRRTLEDVLDSGTIPDGALDTILKAVDALPNRANTVTTPRRPEEQPDYLSTADVSIIEAEREDPNFVFDEDLVWRRIEEEFPDRVTLDNGDLALDEAVVKGKRYQTVLRRTKQNRYMVYVMETDSSSNRRAKRIGDTEWHSYEALEKRIQQGRTLIHSKSPAGSLARRKDQPTENLGTMGFPGDDFLGDFADPNADLPETGDEKFDRLLQVASQHIRDADLDLQGIEAHLEEIDPGATAVTTIMQAIIGRAQSMYKPDTTNPFQLYDGETAEVGMEVDWTDWHQEKDWWITLPNGKRVLNPNKDINENYGEVRRGTVMGYVKENTDGKGHTYGDHVWVKFTNEDGTADGNWVKRSAQTLRLADAGSPLGAPFFSKKEEWRGSPEALARRFRVPEVALDEPVVTKERPRTDLPQSRNIKFSSRGSLAGYTNVSVPNTQADVAGLITRGDITPSVRQMSDARVGMMIVRMDDSGNQWVDTIIRVDNVGDGSFKIHAARPNGLGSADIDSFVVSGETTSVLWDAPAPPEPKKSDPDDDLVGTTVEFELNGVPTIGIIESVGLDGDVETSNGLNTDTIKILKSNIRFVEDPEVPKERRRVLRDTLKEYDIPEYVRHLMLQEFRTPWTKKARIDELIKLASQHHPRTSRDRIIDAILSMIKATPAEKASIRKQFRKIR